MKITLNRNIKLRGAALLAYIARIILAEPRRLNMADWGTPVNPIFSDEYPPCGTVGCIAGWANFLAGKGDYIGQLGEGHAAELLGLNVNQAYELFHVSNWPDELSHKYYHGGTGPEHRAAVTVERINLEIARIKADNLAARRKRYNKKRRLARLAS